MECNQPLSDDQISDALDHLEDDETRQHLDDCPHCQARLAAARRAEVSLMKSLYRYDCLTPTMLRDHALALSTEAEAATIAGHLAVCAVCSAEFAEIKAFLVPEELIVPEIPAKATGGALAQVFTRLGDMLLGPIASQPALTRLRGDAPATLRFEADGMTLFVELESKQNYFGMMGQIVGSDQDRWVGALVECRQDSKVIVTTFVGEAGIFSCEVPDLKPVSLRLIPETGQPVFIDHIQPDR